MQVFRPYIDWRKSARVLDDRRLGKQRVECKQVLNAILRKLGLIVDGKRGWLNHPIVLTYFNSGRPYIADLAGFFRACVDEWRARGYSSSITLEDISGLLSRVDSAEGTPVTHVHEVEYRRILLLKDLNYYFQVFPRDEILEVVETEPVMISGINLWIYKDPKAYDRFVRKLRDMLRRGRQ